MAAFEALQFLLRFPAPICATVQSSVCDHEGTILHDSASLDLIGLVRRLFGWRSSFQRFVRWSDWAQGLFSGHLVYSTGWDWDCGKSSGKFITFHHISTLLIPGLKKLRFFIQRCLTLVHHWHVAVSLFMASGRQPWRMWRENCSRRNWSAWWRLEPSVGRAFVHKMAKPANSRQLFTIFFQVQKPAVETVSVYWCILPLTNSWRDLKNQIRPAPMSMACRYGLDFRTSEITGGKQT